MFTYVHLDKRLDDDFIIVLSLFINVVPLITLPAVAELIIYNLFHIAREITGR